MGEHRAAPPPRRDLRRLQLEYRLDQGLLDTAAPGVHRWQIHVFEDRDGQRRDVGSVRAVRVAFYEIVNVRTRLEDEGGILQRIGRALFGADGEYLPGLDEVIEMPIGDLLVLEELSLEKPWSSAVLAGAIAATVIKRLAGECHMVACPPTVSTGQEESREQLLMEACQLLGTLSFADTGVQLVDLSLRDFGDRADDLLAQLEEQARTGMDGPELALEVLRDDDTQDWEGDEDADWDVTPRTAAVLTLALQDLSDTAWAENRQAHEAATPLFDSLPRITRAQGTDWRRQFARCFDDLAADLEANGDVRPGCTGEEMALHLALRRAPELLGDRPNAVARATENLPEHADDYDWDMCSDILFEDHDVLMLYDNALDGIDDAGNEINRHLGIVDLNPSEWFNPFDQPRDPGRGFRFP